MKKNDWYSGPLFYVLIALYFILGYLTLGWGEKWASILYREDHYFENVGAISLFLASAISFFTFWQAYKNRHLLHLSWFKLLVYLGIALLFFFGAGEEISWGQRIFHLGEPNGMAAVNAQGELNIHNLKIFSSSELLKFDTFFTVFWMGFTVLIPAVGLLSGRSKKIVENFVPVVYWGMGLLFLANYVFAKFAKNIFAGAYSSSVIPFVQAVQEVKESNYELSFVFVALVVLWELNSSLRRLAE